MLEILLEYGRLKKRKNRYRSKNNSKLCVSKHSLKNCSNYIDICEQYYKLKFFLRYSSISPQLETPCEAQKREEKHYTYH